MRANSVMEMNFNEQCVVSGWILKSKYQQYAQDFGSLDAVFALKGQCVSHDSDSEVIYLERAGLGFYIKRYTLPGRGVRRYLGRPRVKAEWQNLNAFARWGIPAVFLVAYGLERNQGLFVRGALITLAQPGRPDLIRLAETKDPRMQDSAWVDNISTQLAQAARTLHRNGCAHNDLKWRNLLVAPQGVLYLIDCPPPSGAFW